MNYENPEIESFKKTNFYVIFIASRRMEDSNDSEKKVSVLLQILFARENDIFFSE